jgi:hypothetical protein
MRALDRGVPRAEPRAHVEGGRAAAADDDVVRVGVMFEPPSYVVAGGRSLMPFFFTLALARDGNRCTRFDFVCILTI